MTNYLPDSPDLGKSYCPGCEPDRDPSKEILITCYCEACKAKIYPGSEDDKTKLGHAIVSGTGEAGGNVSRALGDLIHRGKKIDDLIPDDPPFNHSGGKETDITIPETDHPTEA